MMSAVEEAISQATVKLGYEQLKPELRPSLVERTPSLQATENPFAS